MTTLRHLASFLFLVSAAAAQTHATAPNDLPVTIEQQVLYPSLKTLTTIELTVGTPNSEVKAIVAARANNPNWNCAWPQMYKVEVVKANPDKTAPPDKAYTVIKNLTLASVYLGDDTSTNVPYTHCDAKGRPTSIDLRLATQPHAGDLIRVSILDADRTTVLIANDPSKLTVAATDIPTFTATPQAAPGEALNNGTTRTVGQLAIAFADPLLFPAAPLNVYAKSTDLLSTDGKDSKSAIALTLGAQHGLTPGWYSPVALEQTLQGNQTAKNLSAVTSLGFDALPPQPVWNALSKGLVNRVVLAPLPPEFTVANLYTHRFRQLVTAKTPLLAANDYSLNGAFSWDTISFPFTCKLLFWEKPAPAPTSPNEATGLGTGGPAPGATVNPATTPAALPAPSTSNCLGLEVDLGGWYLPLDHTARGTQKAEGYGDFSLLIPLSDFSFAAQQLNVITKGDSTKFQVRVKYTDAVNQANNYARTRAWTFGIEAIK
jgi:hypothetical protein